MNAPLPCCAGTGDELDSTILDEVAHQKFDTPSKVALHISQTIRHNALAAVAHLDRDLTARALAARFLMLDAGRDWMTGQRSPTLTTSCPRSRRR